jgi:phage host-nuclease inhibitor protein Gam
MEFKPKAMAAVARMAAFAASVSADNAAESARAASAHTLKPYVPGVRIVSIAEEEAAQLALEAQDRLAKEDPKYAAQLELIREMRQLRAEVQALRDAQFKQAAHVAGIYKAVGRWDDEGLPTSRE